MISRERYEKILDYVKAHEADIVRDLNYICRMPSVRSESKIDEEPYGHECAVCLEKCAEMFLSVGFESTVYQRSGYALADNGEKKSGKTIGLYAHTDVVPVNEGEWIVTKPFDPKVIGNCIVGRGVHDNKNAVIAALYIMKAFRDLGIETNAKLQIFLGSNEESGMGDVKVFVKEQKLPDVNLVLDAGYPAAIGQKGILRFNVRSKKPFEDIVYISGGTAYNIVLDKVTAKIRRSTALYEEMMAKATPEIKIDDGNFVTVTAVGKASHAANAGLGINALGLLANFLLKIDALSTSDKKILARVSDSLSDTNGSSWGIAAENDFFGANTCANGIAKLFDGCLDYTFDVRFTDAMPEDEMLGKIQDYFHRGGFEYKQYSLSHCMKRDENSMPIKTFMKGYRAITGETDAKPYVMGGGTYANYLDGGFAIGVAHKCSEKDLKLPEGHGGAHQADEVLCIPDLIQGIAIMAELLLEIDDELG
ncbi:MAG: Sapep family Mn(2+)-dependent dipeptidase [Clostridia bacterium]|nr:Sapep family Mn(2+)-dependent dipeptidase [Clostridia bacterium]